MKEIILIKVARCFLSVYDMRTKGLASAFESAIKVEP